MVFKDKIKIALLFPLSFFSSLFQRRPNVNSKEDTLKELGMKSISRFGDGELQIMLGLGIKFQKKDSVLRKRLIEIASSKQNDCIVAIPPVFRKSDLGKLESRCSNWWKRNLLFTRGHWYRLFKNNSYFDSFISRFYLEYSNKNDASIMSYIKKMKCIWEGKDILFVEGDKSRLGVGNDLFDNAKSTRRILCPSNDAFSKYEIILSAVLKNSSSDDLIICALGPTASVLAYDLSNKGRHALDLGHVDVEYEWFRKKATTAINLEEKYVSESGQAFIENNEFFVKNVICDLSK